jgi:hypothetical protein
MNNLAELLKRSAYRNVVLALAVSLCCVGTACHEGATPQSEAEKKAGLQQPLTSFRQVLTSPKTELKLHPGEDIKIPVHIQNPGTETWVSAGQFPVAVSYKWFRDGQMLVIEGERTALPSAIGPNQAADVDVRVIAPPDPGKYGLRLTLVQEAVAWFMLKSNTFLELPVTVQ